MGESNFVMNVLSESEENFSRKYQLKSRGYNIEKVAERVCSLFDLEKDYITARGRQRNRVRARDLLCYWCAIELRIPMADLSKRLDMTLSAVSYAVKRGEKIAKGADFQLDD
jgi:chromosomal replication initiation ATPase DnaA